ncbi:MAG: thioredoxin family protein [Leptolyngbyaceae cyanobacterium SM2_5_2]|nr:thioredoxin family protein [Leptolyngbyaceae cyanobacterium SM2_5_2]
MLKNCIADYAPAQAQIVSLNQNEVVHHSFLVTVVKKQGLGYRPESKVELGCHLTNQRLILKPVNTASDIDVQSFLLSEIEGFKVVRSLALTSYAQFSIKPSQHQPSKDLLLAVRAFPHQQSGVNATNRSEDFVHLGNGLLGLGHGPTSANPKVQALQAALAHEGLVLVNFWLPGCRPCMELEKVLESLLGQYGDQIKLFSLNAENNQEIAMQYGVECFPTVLLVKSGVVVNQIVGAIPKSIVTKLLERHVQPVVLKVNA